MSTGVEQGRSLATLSTEWLDVGLSTEPADRQRAERAVADAYAAVSLRPPQTIVWTGSPYAGILASHLLNAQLHGSAVTDRFWRLRRRLTRQARRRTTEMAWREIVQHLRPVEAQVWDGVGSVLETQLRVVNRPADEWITRVWDGLREQAGKVLRDRDANDAWDRFLRSMIAGSPPIPPCFGNLDAAWLGQLDAAGRLVGGHDRLTGLVELARSSGWWWPTREAVVLTERPARLERDDDGSLHCENSPAIAYRDGWRLHAWHGVGVARWVIDRPEAVTLQMVVEQQDLPMRRVLLERYGFDRYVREVGSVIQSDDWGTLWQAPLPQDEPVVMVQVLNATPEPDGTFKDYFLRVPPWVNSARQAVAWTFGATEQSYAPQVQT